MTKVSIEAINWSNHWSNYIYPEFSLSHPVSSSAFPSFFSLSVCVKQVSWVRTSTKESNHTQTHTLTHSKKVTKRKWKWDRKTDKEHKRDGEKETNRERQRQMKRKVWQRQKEEKQIKRQSELNGSERVEEKEKEREKKETDRPYTLLTHFMLSRGLKSLKLPSFMVCLFVRRILMMSSNRTAADDSTNTTCLEHDKHTFRRRHVAHLAILITPKLIKG